MNNIYFFVYALLFVLLGLMLVSFFLVWNWFDARQQVAVVRANSRGETIDAIRHHHNKCRILIYISLALTLCYIAIPFIFHDFYNTLAYPAVVTCVDIALLATLHFRAKDYIAHIDDYIIENEEHVKEAIEELKQTRNQWKAQASKLNPIAERQIQEFLGDNYETWFEHDILTSHNVLANLETGTLYAQGIVLSFSEIMEVRLGRKDLKLVTSNSAYPFITIDFDLLPIDPETGEKYKDQIADKIEHAIH